MSMSIEKQIMSILKKKGRGHIFFPSDFAKIANNKSIHKALERLTNDSRIIRVAQGIYCYPKTETELGLGVLYPSFEEIAESLAKRDKARIVPTGQYALNKLGLSTQIPMNITYLTDGSPRKITISNGRGIQFKNTVPRNLSFKNKIAMLVTFALKELKKDKVTEDQLKMIKEIIRQVPQSKVEGDYNLMPAWIRTIFVEAYE